MSLSKRERAILKGYWRPCGYAAVRVSEGGTVEAKRTPGGAWGVLSTAEQSRRDLEILKSRIAQRSADFKELLRRAALRRDGRYARGGPTGLDGHGING